MIDYEEELKKFEPCLDVTDAGRGYLRQRTDRYSGYPSGDAEGVQERTQDEIEQEILNELYELRRVSWQIRTWITVLIAGATS